jgi:L-alanine-DL-glutamate epimerase-like enolase superfamily enzyme
MRISAVELRSVRIPFKRAFAHALKARSEAEAVLVLVRSQAGAVGVGEIVPRPYLTGETTARVLDRTGPERARGCLGRTFSSKGAVVAWLKDELERAGRDLATCGGFELAILDLAAKELGFSLTEVLGGRQGAELPPGVVIGFEVKTPELERHCALLRLAHRRHLKVKVGQADDLERLAIISRTMGLDLPLRLDANAAWTADQAIACLQGMRAFNIQSVEQPVAADDLQGMHRVQSETGLPVMADESLCTLEDGRRLIAAQAAAIFSIRIGKCGGLLGGLRLVELARAAGLGLHLGALVGETAVLARAGELFGRCVAGFSCLEGKGQNRFLLEGDVGRQTEGGAGLGLEVEEDWLRQYQESHQEFA